MHDRLVSPNGNTSASKGWTALRIFYILAATLGLLAMVACSGGWGERPEIVQGPANQTVISGQTATFNITVAGTAPLSYQWFEGGVALSGATGSSYTTPVTSGSDNGSVFSVTVTNAAGAVASASAILTVNVPPAIVTPPLNQTTIAGQTATFSVTATGTAPLVYQWFRGSSAISGATSSTYTTPVTAGSDNGAVFSVVVSNMAGTVTSSTATLTVNVPPAITLQPVSDRVDAGSTATFSVAATGTAPLSYQWYRSGAPIPGAMASSYTTAATAGSDNGAVFTVSVTNVAGTVTSAAATLHVNLGPTITVQPLSQTITAGQTATLSVVATGTYPMTYQWSLNGAPIGGATSSFYTTPALSGTNNGALYTVAVTNVVGTTTSTPAVLTVNVPPTISVQPVSQTVTAPATAAFSVVAAGTSPLSYQWYLNGALIPGAVSSSYVTGTTTGDNSGAVYTVTITNVAGSVTSAAATLTVNVTPSITTEPVSKTVNAGQTATFFVTATGTSPLNYQWYQNGSLISGATGRYYTTPATVSGDSGAAYSVVVSNVAGNVTSTEATLTVNTAPTITVQPASQTVNAPAAGTFSVTATGTSPLSYQWYANGAQIGGATASTYTTPATASSDNGVLYTVVVTNTAGSATSSAATLTVDTVPTILAQPVSQTVTAPGTATFSVVASGSGTLTYQWYLNGSPISGAMSSSYTTPATTASNNDSNYTVKVTNSTGSVMSAAATLNVDTTPLANGLTCSSATPPYNSSITLVPNFSGGTAVIGTSGFGSSDITSSAVSGSPYVSAALTSATTFTLTVSGTGGASAATTCTATPATVTITPITPATQTIAPGTQTFGATVTGGVTDNITWTANGGSFSGDVWTSPNAAGTYTITATSVDNPTVHTSTTITISAPTVAMQPVSQSVCVGSSVTLAVAANYAASYQWNLGGTPLSGANSSSYFIASAASQDAGNYTCTITNPAGNITSGIATVVVGSSITSNPASLTASASQTATFNVAATGKGPFTYQWYVIASGSSSGTAISGATSSSYTTGALTSAANGSQYYATVIDGCETTLTSSNATLTVNNNNVPPTITTEPAGQTVVAGSTPTFTVGAAGSPTLSYQWYVIPAGSSTGTVISTNGTSATYTLPATSTALNNDQDQYYAVVTNSYGQAVSEDATLAVGNGVLIQIEDQPQDDYVDAGAPGSFTVTATSTLPLTYQWYEAPPGSSTFTAISGATSATYTIPSTDVSQYGSVFYVVVSNGSTSPVTSSSASLFVGPLNGVGNLCSSPWVALDNATAESGCSFQLTAASGTQHGEIVWPNLIATANMQLSFTVTMSNPSNPPADGFAVVLGDPSLGAKSTSIGATGQGLGAQGIPGFVLGFDTYENGLPDASSVPYMGITRGETNLWERPWFNINTNIPALVAVGESIAHNYVISLVNGHMSVTMDGAQVFSGAVKVPPVAYLYITSSTGLYDEQTVISNLSATVSTPPSN